ncbi:MAG TPA: hypothetical protein VKG84_07935 [Candidatus Acidoferrales bacterium]|nr:hypothetical protein [Candidatus Acidoferrales bacterium]
MRGVEKLRVAGAALLVLALSVNAGASRGQANPAATAANPPAEAKLDARTRALIPAKARIRTALDLHLAPQGETLIVYEQPDKDSGETVAALALVREGKRIPFRGEQAEDMILDCTFGSAQTLPIEAGRQALVLALVCSPDGSFANFMILRWADAMGYAWDFLEGYHAQLRIALGNPTKMELWSAAGGCGDFKKPEATCQTCPQRYSIRRYEWHSSHLDEIKKGENLTKECLDPRQMARTPIVMGPTAGR